MSLNSRGTTNEPGSGIGWPASEAHRERASGNSEIKREDLPETEPIQQRTLIAEVSEHMEREDHEGHPQGRVVRALEA